MENEQINTPVEEVSEAPKGRIEQVEIDRQMRSAYIDYSMSVIVSRALPDVRDGMKPVQRRVLYGMERLGLDYSAGTVKSAGIVGEVMGKYHPHGDSSIYDTMVRMAQDWNLRYPLVKGQGNFGSMDGYSAAAMRYTEAKMEKISEAVMADLDKDTVDMVRNFDERFLEPTVLPTRIPVLLVNGSAGIAVGMATNMAPHNLGECCDAVCAYIDNPDITIPELMEYIKAPDFPTGGIIQGISGVKEAYETGRGRVVIRSKVEIENSESGRQVIVVTEVPYMVNKKEMCQKIADLVEDKKIDGISYINDETDLKKGVRIVIKLKKDANANVVLNMLYKYSPLQSSFSINNVALVGGRPRTLNLKDLIVNFVKHRHEVVVRRTKFDLAKAEARAHILEGLLKALDIIDQVIATIRESKSVEDAKTALMDKFGFSDAQASAIVEMRLRQLAGLERLKLQAEYDELVKFIADCKDILARPERQMELIKQETMEVKEKYGDARRTQIVPAEGEFNPEDFVSDEDSVITISHLGYIKRTALTEFKSQNRGGVGSKGGATRDEDFIEHIYVANNRSTILLFTEKGRCYWLKVYEIPECPRTSKGRQIQNVIYMEPDDKIKTYLNVRDLRKSENVEGKFITLVTKRGVIKKTAVENYTHPRTKGIFAIDIREGDELLEAVLTNGSNEIMMAARAGRCVRFDESDVRAMGRTAAGVRGISIEEDNEVVGVITHDPSGDEGQSVLVVSEHGFGKRTDVEEYRLTSRGSKGVKTINITDKTGPLVAIKNVTEDNDLMIITEAGLVIRMHVSDIKLAGRATQGVKLINIRDNDGIAAVCVVPREEEEEEASVQTEAPAQVETEEK
ncbi:MAG: DNA gyrase subunit A [Bacteroidales bacterium]|nr:DNA gyrase subunit A [Bacteroidales bacterium]